MKFKVGEIVVIKSVNFPELNNQEAEILSNAFLDSNSDYGYRTDNNPPSYSSWGESSLSKLPPKDEPGSYEALESICGFIPEGVKI